ncbi:MAG: T9SS type A sorting domain-containing protein [Chitinophagaceae bacterium]
MKKNYPQSILLLSSFLLLFGISHAQQIAFPGAEGAGKFTSGGRGTPAMLTKVFEVTSLDDVNTPGTLRYACAQSIATYPFRTIVFRVSGTIHLGVKLSIPKNTTVAGQTAPGDGICVADFPTVINGDNVIVRYMRFRMGDKNQLKTTPSGCGVPVAPFTPACMPLDGSGGDDALGDLGHKNLIIDHCSVSWSNDEALTMYRGDSLTLQWNLISEPLNYSFHFETGDTDFEMHGYGGIWGALHGSFHHNLIANCRNRTPRFAGNSTYAPGAIESADFRNNVLYNWGINNIYGGDGGQYNIVNNYYKFGPLTSSGVKSRVVGVDSTAAFGYAKYYLSGNYVDGSPANTANNWSGAGMNTGNLADTVKSKSNTPFLSGYLPLTTDDPAAAYDTVLKAVGCVIPTRDTLDIRIIGNVIARTGKFIDVQGDHPHGTPYAQTVNAWPTLVSAAAPIDSDHDGMPDTWETNNGLNPNNPADRGLVAGNGYTNLENYLNSISGTMAAVVPTTAASASWTLLADQTPSVSGNITATNQALGSYLAGLQYNSTFGTITGWQRSGTTSFLPVWYNANSYVEYTVTPTAGKKFTTDSIVLSSLGGGTGTAKMILYYSLDGFATSAPLGATTYNGFSYAAMDTTAPIALLNTSTTPLTGGQVASAITSIVVMPGQTLSIRAYVWITGSGNRYYASQGVKVFGTTSDVVVPLLLTNFSAVREYGQVKLNWKTANESNMNQFELQKSIDGQTFYPAGTVAANNTATASYAFTDNVAQSGLVYYRLKMIGKDGSFKYSFIVAVTNTKQKESLSVFPNPVMNSVTLGYEKATKNASLSVLNVEGRKMLTALIPTGTTQTSFDVTGLLPGMYLLRYSDDKRVQTIKFIKH